MGPRRVKQFQINKIMSIDSPYKVTLKRVIFVIIYPKIKNYDPQKMRKFEVFISIFSRISMMRGQKLQKLHITTHIWPVDWDIGQVLFDSEVDTSGASLVSLS